MRRDYFALNVQTPAGPADALALPTAVVAYDGPADDLRARLTDEAGDPLSADTIDVTCRLQAHDNRDHCVVALTHRLTGTFLLEVNAETAAVQDLVKAARGVDDESTAYRVRIEFADGDNIVYEKGTLLVYDDEGSLLRQHSLIPSGVEL